MPNKNNNKAPPLEISKKNINRKLGNCMKKYKIMNSKFQGNYTYNSKEEYDKSFKDEKILEFSKKIKEDDKNKIDYIIYNAGNADGVFSAYVAWRYLYLDNNSKYIRFEAGKPHFGKGYDDRLKYDNMRDKNILVVDLAYNRETFEKIKNSANSLIIIDDHSVKKNNVKNKNYEEFVGNTHASCAYTWKFFYPTKEVPEFIQAVDSNDLKFTLSYIPFVQLMTSSVSYKFVFNAMPSFHKQKFDFEKGMFPQLHDIVEMDDVNFYLTIGKYYEEVIENLKFQIARNAMPAKFQGFDVGVLNYNDPANVKRIGRQIITNFEENGNKIDFAVVWGYEYMGGEYNVQLIEKHTHSGPKYNLPEMSKKLGKVGQTKRGGLGKKNVGHFYWPRNKKMDIWDLFENKYI
jgi:hypothetical protein